MRAGSLVPQLPPRGVTSHVASRGSPRLGVVSFGDRLSGHSGPGSSGPRPVASQCLVHPARFVVAVRYPMWDTVVMGKTVAAERETCRGVVLSVDLVETRWAVEFDLVVRLEDGRDISMRAPKALRRSHDGNLAAVRFIVSEGDAIEFTASIVEDRAVRPMGARFVAMVLARPGLSDRADGAHEAMIEAGESAITAASRGALHVAAKGASESSRPAFRPCLRTCSAVSTPGPEIGNR